MIRYLLLLLFIVTVNHLSAQPFRYSNSIFNKVDTLKDVEYAQADFLNNKIGLLSDYNIHDGESKTEKRPLYMDIFMPHADTVSHRPAIIFAHSGAFLIGSRKADDMIAFCDSFARRGYVTSTIDYRMGMGSDVSRFLGIIYNIRIEYRNAHRTAYRAAQDVRAAIRFLKHNAEIYGIDTTEIFFAGSSAGGILGLYNIYNDKESEFDSSVFDSPSLGLIDDVGIKGYGARANALTSMWGAVQNTNVIENENTPVFLIHGTDDPVVPFKKGIPLDSMVPENPILSFTMPETYGSFCIDTALTNKNIPHETYFMEGGIHEFYGTDTGTFPEEGPNVYWDTVQSKIKHFFFHLFQPEAEYEFLANNLEVNFSNTSSQSNYSFWDFGDGTTTTGKEVNHSYSIPGNYKVQLTTCNQNMACDTLTKTVFAGTPVFVENNWIDEIEIFPNPVSQYLEVKGINRLYDAKIIDFTGRIQFIKRNISYNTFDVSQLKNGIYFVELGIKNERIIRKFIKVN